MTPSPVTFSDIIIIIFASWIIAKYFIAIVLSNTDILTQKKIGGVITLACENYFRDATLPLRGVKKSVSYP